MAVGDYGNIVKSTDNGSTWDNATRPFTNDWTSRVAFGNNTFVTVGGSNGTILTSSDNGTSWDNRTSAAASTYLGGLTFSE